MTDAHDHFGRWFGLFVVAVFVALALALLAGRQDLASMLGGLLYCGVTGVGLISVSLICLKGIRSLRWPTTVGAIVQARVLPVTTDTHHQLLFARSVVYTYQVNGESFRGGRVRFGEVYWAWRACARRGVRCFTRGARVLVYYSPSEPCVAVLEPGLNVVSFGALLFMLALNAPTALLVYRVTGFLR